MYPGIRAGGARFAGHDGDQIGAYQAVPDQPGARAGIIVLHHMLGLDESTRESAVRFSAHGYTTVCPNLHSREMAPGITREDAAAACRAAGGVPDARLLGDVQGSIDFLKLTGKVDRVGLIGYCSGGRQAFLAACSLELDAVVDCYGSFVNNAPPPRIPLKVTPLLPLAGGLRCPLLCLYGAEDPNPSPSDAAEIAATLKGLGKTYESEIYPSAGHGFFDTGSVRYDPVAARDGWDRVLEFFDRHLVSDAPTRS